MDSGPFDDFLRMKALLQQQRFALSPYGSHHPLAYMKCPNFFNEYQRRDDGTEFDIYVADLKELEQFHEVIVASTIFASQSFQERYFHMAILEDDQEHGWIEKVKSEGSVPLLEPGHCPNGWTSPSGDVFKVRGPEYLKTKAKIPGGDYLLEPLGFDWIKGPTKISELLNNTKSRVRRALDDEISKDCKKPFIWAFNLQVPSKENYSAVAYFVGMEPIPDGSLMDQFLKGDDGFRNSRLKLIANIVKGPWIVRKAVGEQAICIIGRAVTCKYCLGENFIEVDIDIGSSVVANAIVHLAFGYITMLTVDLAFLIEGQTESELPERILGAVRFSELNTASARQVELHSEKSTENLPSSLPTRFWKSLGQGFSHFIKPVGQESDSNSHAAYVNGDVDDKSSADVSKL